MLRPRDSTWAARNVVGERERGDVVAARAGFDRFQDLLHRRRLPTGNRGPKRSRKGRRRCSKTLVREHIEEKDPVHAGFVIVAGARTPIGKMSGAFASLLRGRPRGGRDQGRARARRRRARRGRARADGPGADGRARPGSGPPGRGQGRHPDERARRSTSTRCACRAQHHLPRRPDDRRRRGRHRRRRRHGVDDQRALHAAAAPVAGSGTATPSWPTPSSRTACGARSTPA